MASFDTQVRGKKLHHYSGSYSNFMDQRTMRANQAASILAKEQEEIARLEDFIARFGAKVRVSNELHCCSPASLPLETSREELARVCQFTSPGPRVHSVAHASMGVPWAG